MMNPLIVVGNGIHGANNVEHDLPHFLDRLNRSSHLANANRKLLGAQRRVQKAGTRTIQKHVSLPQL